MFSSIFLSHNEGFIQCFSNLYIGTDSLVSILFWVYTFSSSFTFNCQNSQNLPLDSIEIVREYHTALCILVFILLFFDLIPLFHHTNYTYVECFFPYTQVCHFVFIYFLVSLFYILFSILSFVHILLLFLKEEGCNMNDPFCSVMVA